MERRALLSIMLAIALAVSGCATSQRKPNASTLGARPLVAPSALANDRAANQVIHGAFGNRELTLSAVLSVRNGTVTVIGLTALGVRAFTISYDGTNIKADNDLPAPEQLTPERLLADIQLVFWPVASLEPALSKQGWQLTVPFERTRRLKYGDKLIVEVHYETGDPWVGRSWLVNLEFGYTLGIESSPLPAR